MWSYSATIRAERKASASRPTSVKVKKSSKGSSAAIQTLPVNVSAYTSSPPAPVAPLSFCAGMPTTVHRPRAGFVASNRPLHASSAARISCRQAPSAAAPNPPNRPSRQHPAAGNWPSPTPQSPPTARPFPADHLHSSPLRPPPAPRFSPDTPSTPFAEILPSPRAHFLARCPLLPRAPPPQLAAPHRCNTLNSSAVFPLLASSVHNSQTRDRFPSAPLPAAPPHAAMSP